MTITNNILRLMDQIAQQPNMLQSTPGDKDVKYSPQNESPRKWREKRPVTFLSNRRHFVLQ